jgi:acetolactate synthase-1/3 small subunit
VTNHLHIELDRAEGSLQRLIGLIERRGFHIDELEVSTSGAYHHVRVAVRGRDAGRNTEVLARQIDRLFGVRNLTQSASPFVEEVRVCPA